MTATGAPGDPDSIRSLCATVDRLAQLVERLIERANLPAIPEPGPPLTAREVEIGRMLIAGKSRKEIAHELVLSEWTIKTHTEKLYRKLGIHSKGELRAHLERREVEAAAPELQD